jgi:hypothetical protein
LPTSIVTFRRRESAVIREVVRLALGGAAFRLETFEMIDAADVVEAKAAEDRR